jgi:hypothetical protein
MWVEEVVRGRGQDRPLSMPFGRCVLFKGGEQPFELSLRGPWESQGEQALLLKLIARKPRQSRSP